MNFTYRSLLPKKNATAAFFWPFNVKDMFVATIHQWWLSAQVRPASLRSQIDVAREGQLLPLVLVELIYRLNDLPYVVFGGAF